MVEWPRGEATACKAVYTGSNPVSTSKVPTATRAISSVGEHYLDTVGVTGSIPVSPTIVCAGQGWFLVAKVVACTYPCTYLGSACRADR